MTRVGRASRPAVLLLALLTMLGAWAAAQGAVIDSVESLVAAFATGGDYRIAPGSYAVDVGLEAAGTLRIVGDDRDRVLIESWGVPIAVRVHEGASLHLEGLRLVSLGDGPSDLIVVRQGDLTLRGVDLGFARAGTIDPPDPWRSGGHGSAVVGQGSAVLAVEDSRVTLSGNTAFEMLGTSTLRLDGVMIVDNQRGLMAGEEARIDVTDTLFLDQVAQAVMLFDDVRASFVDTGFGGNGAFDPDRQRFLEAIRVVDRASATFRGGVLRDSPTTGLGVGGAAEVVVDGMLIEGNGTVLDDGSRRWSAVFVTGDGRMAVQRSTLQRNGGGAFDVRGGATLVIEDATVAANGSFAHTTATEGATLVMQGSRVVDNEGAMFVTGSARAVIDATVIVDGATSGVVIGESARVEVTGSTIAGHAARGVWIDGDASVDLIDNTIDGNEMGLWMTGAATAVVNHNRIRSNRHSGAVLLEATRGAFARNEIAGNARNGVALAEASRGLLEENHIVANGIVGVLIVDEAAGTLERNTITGSDAGVLIEDQAVANGADNVFAANGQDVADER